MAKLKFAFWWAASCGGCEVTVLDTNEKILEIADAADIVLWPVALDFKYRDVEALPDGSIDVSFLNGGIRNSEAEEIARLLRRKSKALVAFGSCACFGGVPGLANQYDRESILERVYGTTPSTEAGRNGRPRTTWTSPEGELHLPTFSEAVRPLAEVVPVDYFLGGCPPPSDLVGEAVDAIVGGALPPPGSFLGPEKNLCDECEKERSDEKEVHAFRRPHEIRPDPERCLLEQGIICSGPATRAGCKARCPAVDMPCRGCMGPAPGTADPGLKLLSSLASVMGPASDDELERLKKEIRDRISLYYHFTYPSSLLDRMRRSGGAA